MKYQQTYFGVCLHVWSKRLTEYDLMSNEMYCAQIIAITSQRKLYETFQEHERQRTSIEDCKKFGFVNEENWLVPTIDVIVGAKQFSQLSAFRFVVPQMQ